jgi:hypothetical protein
MLTRTGLLTLAAAVLLTGAVRADGPKPAAKPTPIYKAEQPIRIDGSLDDPVWQKAVPVEANFIHGKVGQRSKEPRMTAKFAWDDHYLYIAYETFDKNLVALGTGEKKGPKGNQRERCLISHPTEKVDVVEFFISFGDEHVFWEVHHNAANHFSDILITTADDSWPISQSSLFRFGIHFGTDEVLQDDVDAGRTRAMAVKLKPKKDGKPSTVNDPSDEDTGYTGVLRLPWYGLGAPVARETFVTVDEGGKKKNVHGPWKMAGQGLMILAVVQDGDLPDRYHHSSPTKPGGWFHKGADLWPRYVLEPAK